VHEFLVTQGGGRVTAGIRERVQRVPGVDSVVVEQTWNPPWTIARMNDTGRRVVGLFV
jgi:metal-sulfur cluster biosynthetic enzyme